MNIEKQQEFLQLCLQGNIEEIRKALDTDLPTGEIELDGLIDFETPEDEELGSPATLRESVSALHIAVHARHREVVDLLIDIGANPNIADKYGIVPLFIALVFNKPEIEQILIERGADPKLLNTYSQICSLIASQNSVERKEELFEEYQLDLKIKDDRYPEVLYGVMGFDEISRGGIEFLSRKFDINKETESYGHGLQSTFTFTPIQIAAYCGNYKAVSYLAEFGAKINVGGVVASETRAASFSIMDCAIRSPKYNKETACAVIKNGGRIELRINSPLDRADFKAARKMQDKNGGDTYLYSDRRRGTSEYLLSILEESRALRTSSGPNLAKHLEKSEYGEAQDSKVDFVAACMVQKKDGTSALHSTIDRRGKVDKEKLGALMGKAGKLGKLDELTELALRVHKLDLNDMAQVTAIAGLAADGEVAYKENPPAPSVTYGLGGLDSDIDPGDPVAASHMDATDDVGGAAADGYMDVTGGVGAAAAGYMDVTGGDGAGRDSPSPSTSTAASESSRMVNNLLNPRSQ